MVMIERSVAEDRPQQFYTDAMAKLLTLVRPYMTPDEMGMVIRAFHLALETCQGVAGTRPIPPLEHALAVTTILAQMMHIDAIGIAAGLVFEAVDAELLPLERVEQVLGVPTARVVGSMWRLNILERKKQHVASGNTNPQLVALKKVHDERDEGASATGESKKPRIREALRRQQSETVRKMFVAMAEDPRVVLLKLAYRLHAMRLICGDAYRGEPHELLTMSQETREIYAPLAGRLGMSRVESELEDLSFQMLEPEQFAWVRSIVELERKQWRSYVERVCTILREEMAEINVKAEVSGRVKHYYSFYKKLIRGVSDEIKSFEELKAAADVSQIHDLIAFRILVDTTTDCYVALGHVHSLWKPKEGRIKDFIANPKPNGYQALHTTIFCLDDQLVEIQIRTHEMHETAEYGVAMHWHYKDVGDTASSSAKDLLTWLRQLSDWQRELRTSSASDSEFVQAVKDDLFQEQIFVFTPRGEVKDLPVGSTPLDFAYRVHSEVGDKCAGARIITQVGNDEGERLVTRMVPLDYELKSGEIIDIITNRTAHPTRDWLGFAHTAAARSKIRRYLKTHERPINIQIGRERLERELKFLTPRSLESMTEDAEHWLCAECGMEALEDLLAAIGSDDVRPHAIAVKLAEYWQARDGKESRDKVEEETLVLPAVSVKPRPAQVEVAGVSGLLTRLANCCCPLPSDEIVGFISRGKGVIVHRADCRNVTRLSERNRERIITVTWNGINQQLYHAPIIITARNRTGLVRDITAVISDLGMSLMAMTTHVNESRQQAIVSVTLEVDDLEQLERAFTRLERIKDVVRVERDLGKRR